MSTRDKGFTLVEILVAIAIIAILLSTVYGIFSSVSKARQKLETEGQTYQLARVIFERLGRELQGAYYVTTNLHSEFAGGLTEDGRPFLELSTTASTPQGGKLTGIAAVRYELQPDPQSPAGEKQSQELMRTEVPLFEVPDPNAKPYRLARGISKLTFRFYRDGKWQPSWNAQNDGGLPEMVEVTLVLGTGKDATPFQTTFEIPSVKGGTS
ncbi:MAG TPA: type II secretion system protein GspJ [Desulfuromonadales bacterium]|nr:type II secretion system protein GspJ [Desulfuromonadales bacterium]